MAASLPTLNPLRKAIVRSVCQAIRRSRHSRPTETVHDGNRVANDLRNGRRIFAGDAYGHTVTIVHEDGRDGDGLTEEIPLSALEPARIRVRTEFDMFVEVIGDEV